MNSPKIVSFVECPECGKQYKVKFELTKHLKNKHSFTLEEAQLYCKNLNVKTNSEIKRYEKQKEKLLKKYGVNCSLQIKEVKEKIRQNTIEQYGVEHILQIPEVQEKRKQTCLEKYGMPCALQSQEVRKKTKETLLEKYGVENISQSEEIKEKKRQTCQERFGTNTPFEADEVKEKIREALIDKYGKDNFYLVPTIGANEKQILDKQEKIDNCIIDRKFRVGLYYPDGYCHETNTIYEVYEQYHYMSEEQVKKDLERQLWIQDQLKCNFVIIEDKTH